MDRAGEMLIEALKQALGADAPQRLYRSGKLDGLFPSRTGLAGDVASGAVREHLLEVVRTEIKGKTESEWVRITPLGVEFLHEHESPACALRDLLAALKSGKEQVPAWLTEVRANLHGLEHRLAADAERWNARLDALERRVEAALRRLEAGAPLLPPELARDHPWAIDALNYLDRRISGGANNPCSLQELFEAVSLHHPGLSIPAFHDGLRALHQRRTLRLRPVESLDDIAGAEYALLDGEAVLSHVER